MFEDSTHGGRQNWWLRYPTFLRTSTHALTEGDSFIGNWRCALIISTHALTEGDSATFTFPAHSRLFQLTPSRRATRYCPECTAEQRISTHALTEGDSGSPNHYADYTFQLTPSRRATQPYSTHFRILKFQLTPSRRATLIKTHKNLL